MDTEVVLNEGNKSLISKNIVIGEVTSSDEVVIKDVSDKQPVNLEEGVFPSYMDVLSGPSTLVLEYTCFAMVENENGGGWIIRSDDNLK